MKPESKDPLAKIRERWSAYYSGLDDPSRRRLWLGLSLTLLLGGGLALLLGRTRWTVLFGGLEARDASAMVEKLKAAKIPYQLDKDGTEILVPDTAVSEQRMDLAAAGLPQGQGKGWELMDQNNLLLSDEASRTNHQRALQGELERSIASLRGVEAVRVHLVVPEQRLFNQAQEGSSASIVLKMQPGVQMGDQEALSIAYLVSHAVEGLKPESVAIVDTEGHDLGLGGPGGGAQEGVRIEAGRKVERQLHDQVQSLLDEALGPDKAIVRVHADINFDTEHVSKEIYEAPSKTGGLVREESSDASQDGASSPSAGNTTIAGNSGPQVVGGTSKASTRNNRRVSYELNKTVQDITSDTGSIKRVTVSVLLKEALPAEELTALSDAVNKTVGIDASRGDQMSLAVIPAQAMAAAQTQAKAKEQAMAKDSETERWTMLAEQLAPWAVAALLVVVVAALAWRALRMVPSQPRSAAKGSLDAAALQAALGGIDLPPGASEEDLKRLIERYPSSAAQVLRRMMTN